MRKPTALAPPRAAAWVRKLLGGALVFSVLGAPAAAQTVYLAFGDSITEGVGDDPSREELGYPPRLEELFSEAGETVTVVNGGLGGEETPEGLTRIDPLLAEGGDVLLLMEGTNDVGRGLSLETTRFNLAEMARKAEAQGFAVVFATTIPRFPSARKDPENLATQQLAQEIRDLAGTTRRRLADPFEVFGTTTNVFRDYYDDDPGDRVGHPNSDGYDLLAGIFFDLLRGEDTVPPVPGRLTPNNGATQVGAGSTLTVDLWDFGEGLDVNSTRLLLNGELVAPAITGNAQMTRLIYTPPAPLAGVIEVTLQSQDFASPPNEVDRVISTTRPEGK